MEHAVDVLAHARHEQLVEAVVGVDPEEDARRFHVSEGGVVLVTPEMLNQKLHYAR